MPCNGTMGFPLSRLQIVRVEDAAAVAGGSTPSFGVSQYEDAMFERAAELATYHRVTPEQAQAAFRSELAKYAALVKKTGIEPE